ncbi:pentapeptide repeat-containing protein [Chitinophaga sp. 212800010-3]|uniref:pentapeptide repeat-containing protein n=1 Tax=unclassified Chitinophaga TaxID=2619133 RepID=UPI002DF01C1D|nr:Cro/Cl family transcriptional regulator [Chitinophaga sp. 212800010-3]
MDTKIIGGKIAKARKAVNMSQAQLAQQLFISAQAVGKWERGESMPDITTFNRLADILGVDLNYFSENGASAVSEMPPLESLAKQPMQEAAPLPRSGRQIEINLTAANLQDSDFAGVILHNGKFKASQLRGANFAGADLTGSLFEVIDARQTNFDDANLTDCHFSVTELSEASFCNSILVRTSLSMSGQGAKFRDVKLIDVKIIKTDLRKTIFENCTFNGTDFTYCDLRGIRFDGQSFIDVKFDKSALNDVSFRGATFRNVSFTPPFSLTNKAFLAMKTICFDGATMDKLTYVVLKGLGVIDLSKVTVI